MNYQENEFDSSEMKQENPPEQTDPFLLQNIQERIKSEQNLLLGFIAAGAAALLSAIVWALVTVATDAQIGWMAIGAGILVGLANRYAGKGIDKKFGVIGGFWAFVSIIFGNLLAVAIFFSKMDSVPVTQVLLAMLLSPIVVIDILSATFTLIDLLFYGLAIYEGYRFSFRQVK